VSEPFRHTDAERTIIFGPGALEAAEELLGEGFALLSTPRAALAAPSVQARAATVTFVPSGTVEEVAGALRPQVRGERLVALGGGRVIDVAKALAAADPPRTVAAIPTTVSAAEMTGVHRHAAGVAPLTARVRPLVVVNDPALSASQPPDQLAASSANALGHALIALVSVRSTPISSAVAQEAASRIVGAWPGPEPGRPRLALGALLAGWALDHAGLGLHHVLAQTAVRTTGLGHAQANAALLPATVAAMRARRPQELAGLDDRLGIGLEVFAWRLREWAGVEGIPAFIGDAELLERSVEAAATRPELERVPPAPDRSELRRIYLAAAAPAPG
jgi:maleylacetate reductase